MQTDRFFTPYGALQLLAIGLFLVLLESRLRRRGESLAGRSWLVAATVLAAGLLGRIHFAVEGFLSGRIAAGEIPAALSFTAPGSTFFGAMAGVVLALLILRRWIPGSSFLRLADDTVPGIGLAILVGRIGCLTHGCCLGEPSGLPWALPPALHADADALRLHPLALYLGLWGLAGALLAGRIARRVPTAAGSKPGTRFLLFVVLFGIGRGILESFRLRLPAEIPTGSWGQPEAFLLALVAGVTLLLRTGIGGRSRPRHDPEPDDGRRARCRMTADTIRTG